MRSPLTFAQAPRGRLQHMPNERLGRHCHDEAFVAVVLSGGYQEAGDEGRWNVGPGDVLVHHAFESHLDRFEPKGAEVLILNLPRALASQSSVTGRVKDVDALIRQAEVDRGAAEALLVADFVPQRPAALDWPDILACDLRRREPLVLADWAEAAGVRPETLSRGFRAAFDCTPKAYRARARTRAALAAAQRGKESLTELAHAFDFADQAHMTRAIAALTGMPPGRFRRTSIAFNREGAVAA